MKRLIIFLLLFAAIKVAGQTTGYLRFDTVMIYKVGGTAELVLMNKTKDSLGVLTNYGNGRTRFMKSRAINDSTIVVGLDTVVIRGATGGSSGTTTIVRKPIIVYQGSGSNPDSLDFYYDTSTLRITGDSALAVRMDTIYNVLTRAIVVIDTIEFIHTGSNLTTYQSDTLIGAKLTLLFLEDYPVPFIERSSSVWIEFDSETGTITFNNGWISDDDLVKIVFRHYAIFLVDEDGNLVTDENGNYIILN